MVYLLRPSGDCSPNDLQPQRTHSVPTDQNRALHFLAEDSSVELLADSLVKDPAPDPVCSVLCVSAFRPSPASLAIAACAGGFELSHALGRGVKRNCGGGE